MRPVRYRSQRPGPEGPIEDAVTRCATRLFGTGTGRSWAALSMTIGAGMPDLTVVQFQARVIASSGLDARNAGLLAYLRGVRAARAETIADRIGRPVRAVTCVLADLVDARAVEPIGEAFALSAAWREVLSDVVTVEAKVGDWRVAAGQARRNGIFAHRCYVALPAALADRVCGEPEFSRTGVGVLAVEGREAWEVAPPRRSRPQVWPYYYRIALEAARHFARKGGEVGLHGSDRRRTGQVPRV